MNAIRLLQFGCLVSCLALGASGCDEELPYDCSVFPEASSSEYILPWRVSQSHVANPHAARETTLQKYAVDIPMPIGTEVLAIRDGVVVRVRVSYPDYDNTPGHENYIYVQHADGTVARYLHLTQDGAKVSVGQNVKAGEVLGFSGHTGDSTDPHLHIDLARTCCSYSPEYNKLPAGETIPLSFKNALPETSKAAVSSSNCGLRKNVAYKAMPY